MAIASFVGMITRKLRLPYTVGLVLIGLVLGLLNRVEGISLPERLLELVQFLVSNITPEFILGLLVTPLVFEAAFHLNWDTLKRDLGLILALAVPGVVVTSLLVGGILYSSNFLMMPAFSFPLALLFGAMIAATDPVAVIALFRTIGVPIRLQILMEAESLFNDGTAIVLFTLISQIVLRSPPTEEHQAIQLILISLSDFIRIAGGGLIIGLLLGWLVSQLISTIDDRLLETTLTTVLAFGSYVIAEEFHVSGVLAVVAAGLVNGNIGPRGMSPTTHLLVTNFWEYAAFLSNSIIFLLIGLEIDISALASRWNAIFLAITAALISRGVVIYSLSWMGNNVSTKWRHILFWGGLRGAIPLVLALSLPMDIPIRSELQLMVFGVVLFTILVQGITTPTVARLLKLSERTELQEEFERRHARAVAARVAYEHLQTMHRRGLLSEHTWKKLSFVLKEHAEKLSESVPEVIEAEPSIETEELIAARREVLGAQRAAINRLLLEGVISEEVFEQLVRGIDTQLARRPDEWADYFRSSSKARPITQIVSAVVQVQDVENAISALTSAGFTVTRISSSGGFLRRKNVILIIGCGSGQEKTIVNLLKHICHKRIEYISTPMESYPIYMPITTPITIGGATIFTMKVERYEEI